MHTDTLGILGGYFASIQPVRIPDLAGFGGEALEFGKGGGILLNSISSEFRRDLLDGGIAIAGQVTQERLFYGTLTQNLPKRLMNLLGPINLAQFNWLIGQQPRGEKADPLITSGWWNNARIRGAPQITACARFKDPERIKPHLFTQDSTPRTKGWIFDTAPADDLKAAQQGRLMIFSEVENTE